MKHIKLLDDTNAIQITSLQGLIDLFTADYELPTFFNRITRSGRWDTHIPEDLADAFCAYRTLTDWGMDAWVDEAGNLIEFKSEADHTLLRWKDTYPELYKAMREFDAKYIRLIDDKAYLTISQPDLYDRPASGLNFPDHKIYGVSVVHSEDISCMDELTFVNAFYLAKTPDEVSNGITEDMLYWIDELLDIELE